MRLLTIILLLLGALAAQAEQAKVTSVRYMMAADHVRVVVQTSSPVEHHFFSLENPDRVVLDIDGARLATKKPVLDDNNPYLLRVRTGVRGEENLRLVFDLKQKIQPKVFTLPDAAGQGSSLVVEFSDRYGRAKDRKKSVASPGRQMVAARSSHERAPASTPRLGPAIRNASAKEGVRISQQLKRVLPKGRDVVVAVDAGHGGKDPGAIGANGSREKDITLAISRKLAESLNRESGIKAILVRDGDYYIGLRKRMEIARKHKADLFVSIHADAFNDPSVRGSSVFTLSNRGATSEAARRLADRENSSDLVGGVSLNVKDEVLASVLLDLSQNATLEASGAVAQRVHNQLSRVGEVHVRQVQRAGFMVLKSPDIPSLLVETAFISNPVEERNLKDTRHQGVLADAITSGIRTYFHANPPYGTKLASIVPKKHAVTKGETLSAIADQYNVSMSKIKSYNALHNEALRVGQVLVIPKGS